MRQRYEEKERNGRKRATISYISLIFRPLPFRLEGDERLHVVVELHGDACVTHVGIVGDELLQCGVEQGEDGLADVITHQFQGIRALLACWGN